MIEPPVLLIAFNRPDTTQKVFDRIRDAKPKKLYVSVDGPRLDKNDEERLCDEVKRLVKIVDWQCESFYLFNEKNLGAEVTVSSAISWVLEKEEFVIVLEDDIIAPKSFFYFMQEMLLKYRNNPQIAMVSGCNPTPIKLPDNKDYLFCIYGHTGGGWGTWKRVWEKFDLYINDFDDKLKPDFLNKISNSISEKKNNREFFLRMKHMGPGVNTWDCCWYYLRLTNELLSVIPRVNLTSNIGVYGLHADGETEGHFRKFEESFIVEKHPDIIQRNIEYDKYHFKKYINKKPLLIYGILHIIIRVFNKALKILGLR